jgi:hypothetical protein
LEEEMLRLRLASVVVAAAAILFSASPANAEVVVTQTGVSITQTVKHPCTGEDVLLSGDLKAEFVTSLSPSGEILVRYSLQAAGLTGSGTAGTPYVLVGEGHGVSSGQRRDRTVTASDFAAVATAFADVHRARATASVSFAIQLSGEVTDVSVDSIFIDQIDC